MADRTGVLDVDQIISQLKQQHGDTVSVDQLGQIVRNLLAPLQHHFEEESDRLADKLADLLAFIHEVRNEVAALRPDDLKSAHIAPASDELDAIVKATEAATETIMDAAEEIDQMADQAPEELAEKMRDVTTRVFEACSFQDLTGQRISKVVKALKEVEARVEHLGATFLTEDGMAKATAGKTAHKGYGADDEQDLLNGPQLPDNAKSQEDIDALFDSLK